MAQARARTAKMAEQQEQLISQLVDHSGVLPTEHVAAEEAAVAARSGAKVLKEEQAAEHERWQAIRSKHETLRQQAEASTQQRDERRAELDQLKGAFATTRDEVQEHRLGQKKLDDSVGLLQKQLAELQAQRKQVEEEITTVSDKHRNLRGIHASLEEEHRDRTLELIAVTENLSSKRAQLQRELNGFQQQFDKAKVQQDQILVEHANLRESLSAFLPEYFQLQTKQATTARELEHARRESELLQWENHKIERDLHMLIKSYDVRA